MNPMFEDRRIRALLLCSARFPLSQLPESVRHIILFTGSSDLALQSHQYEPRAWQGVVTEWMVLKRKDQIDALIAEMLQLNPSASEAELRQKLEFNPDGTLKHWDLSRCGIEQLPPSFGRLELTGKLDLDGNRIASLPESFGGISVGGWLSLSYNQLAGLPESFGGISVGELLDLDNNQLASLPESFGGISVGGNLYLRHNQLASGAVPDSLPNVRGRVYK